MLYGAVVRPAFASVQGKATLAPTQSEPTVSADGLRDRVAASQ